MSARYALALCESCDGSGDGDSDSDSDGEELDTLLVALTAARSS